ncbi:mucin-15 isoform X2 [Kryptolebias marmoratus]|uniref:Mucin 15, cell surface associated n=2 Tax=Kryptolebias marmoratus TaxID=37003 RepID=A0A3Q3EPM3_KRYMA|nr:mucin-15 isoform X2 [Kryptolebias marmoratus]
MKTLKITACLFLLSQALHLASLQSITTTASPVHTIDKAWLRQINNNENGNSLSPEENEFESGLDTSESENDNSGGIPSGFMVENTEEEENVAIQIRGENKTSEDLDISNKTMNSEFENGTTKQPELPEAANPPANSSTELTKSSQTNMTEAEEEFNSSMAADNSTSPRDVSNNNTTLQSTTLAPENGTTKQPTTTPDSDKGLANHTGSTTTSAPTTAAPSTTAPSTTAPSTTAPTTAAPSTAAPNATAPNAAAPNAEAPSTAAPSTAAPSTAAPSTAAPSTTAPGTTAPQIGESTAAAPSETPETSSPTTTDVPSTPEVANKNGIFADGSERGTGAQSGLESDPYRSKRNVAWLAVLGTTAVAACVGVVAYIILKKKHQKAFTHRKLVEEYPADPVLRLDNCEPLDLNFGGSAYSNPGLQADSIQMDSLSGRR